MANTRDLGGGGEIEEYGSTQQKEELRVVPLAMLDRHHHRAHSHTHPHPTRTPAPSWTIKTIVRALLVGTAVAVGVFLLMAGPSMNKSSNVEGMGSNLQHAPYVTYANKTPKPVRVSGIYPNSCFDLIISADTTWTVSHPDGWPPKTITADMGLAPADISCDSFDTSGSDSRMYVIRMRKDGTCYVTN